MWIDVFTIKQEEDGMMALSEGQRGGIIWAKEFKTITVQTQITKWKDKVKIYLCNS